MVIFCWIAVITGIAIVVWFIRSTRQHELEIGRDNPEWLAERERTRAVINTVAVGTLAYGAYRHHRQEEIAHAVAEGIEQAHDHGNWAAPNLDHL